MQRRAGSVADVIAHRSRYHCRCSASLQAYRRYADYEYTTFAFTNWFSLRALGWLVQNGVSVPLSPWNRVKRFVLFAE